MYVCLPVTYLKAFLSDSVSSFGCFGSADLDMVLLTEGVKNSSSLSDMESKMPAIFLATKKDFYNIIVVNTHNIKQINGVQVKTPYKIVNSRFLTKFLY